MPPSLPVSWPFFTQRGLPRAVRGTAHVAAPCCILVPLDEEPRLWHDRPKQRVFGLHPQILVLFSVSPLLKGLSLKHRLLSPDCLLPRLLAFMLKTPPPPPLGEWVTLERSTNCPFISTHDLTLHPGAPICKAILKFLPLYLQT